MKTKGRNNVRKAGQQEILLPDLPEPIIFDILARIPAEILHEKFKYICKSWYNLISGNQKFINTQLTTVQNKCQLLIQAPRNHPRSGGSSHFKTTSIELDEKEVDLKVKNFHMKRMGRIRGSCNGMILVNDTRDEKVLHVLNLVTRCKIAIPPCGSLCPHENCGVALTFNPCTKEYKVVHIYADGYGFEIYRLGCPGDAWGKLPGPYYGKNYERPYDIEVFKWSDPVTIDGHILHWFVESGEYFISMDTREETSSRTPLPHSQEQIDKDKYSLLELTGKLGLMHRISSTEIDVWILNDFHNQVWFKRHSIRAESIHYAYLKDSSGSNKYDGLLPDFTKLIPEIASLRNGEVVLFRPSKKYNTHNRLYLYDIKRKELRKFKIHVRECMSFVSHKSSLASPLLSSWKTEKELFPGRMGDC